MSGKRVGPYRANGRATATRRRPLLESLESRQLLATFEVTNTQDLFPNGTTVPNSLRDAIQRANAAGGQDSITFNIPGTGLHTITPTAPLPAITDALIIDAATQPGNLSTPKVELSGASAGIGANGLRVSSQNVTISGLAINRFQGAGIRVEASRTTIQRCYIGTSANGGGIAANGNSGIYIDSVANNLIGGFDFNRGSLGNVISGNTGDGITLVGSGAGSNVIAGNYIGTDSTGARAVPNTGAGISITNATFNQIGGLLPGYANVISGNGSHGIALSGTANNTSILKNYIGTDGNPTGGLGGQGIPTGGNIAVANGGSGVFVAGATSTTIGLPDYGNYISGNKGAGIELSGASRTVVQGNVIGTDTALARNLGNLRAGVEITGSQNSIGGATDVADGRSNTIAFNGLPLGSGGVSVLSGRRNAILGNSLFSNFGPGILLNSPLGHPLPNDPGDTDSGPNDLQNYPVLDVVGTAAGRTLIQGSLNSRPNTTYLIQFFTSPVRDPNGAGEGQVLLGATQVTTDTNGDAEINVTLSRPSVQGEWLSATATDVLQGNTSEFAYSKQITVANQASLAVEIDPTATATVNGTLEYVIRVSNLSTSTPATNVRFTQDLPAGVQFKSATPNGLTLSGNQVVGNLGTIAPGATTIVRVSVTPTAIGRITTTATVSSSEIDPNTSDNTDTETTEVNIPVNLGVLLPGPVAATIGQNFTVTALVTNSPRPGVDVGTATRVRLEVALPPEVTYVGASTGQGGVIYDVATNTLIAQIGTMAVGSTIAVQIVLAAPATVPTGGVVNVSAAVTSAEIEAPGADPNPNTATLAVDVLPSSDVGVTFTPDRTQALTGDLVSYAYTITNSGPSVATGVSLISPLPAGVDLDAAFPTSAGGTVSDAVIGGVRQVMVSLDSLAPGETATGIIRVRITSTGSGPIQSLAGILRAEPDPVSGNDVARATVIVNPADLALVVAASPGSPAVGGTVTYDLTVTNRGPATATGVRLRDLLPEGVNFVSADPSQGTVALVDGVLTAEFGAIAVNGSATLRLVVQAPRSAMLANAASVVSDQFDPNVGDNGAQTTTAVSPADLAVLVSSDTASALAGNPITFTAVVANRGPFAATNVTLTNALPAGFVLSSASATQGSVLGVAGTVTGLLGTLQPGATATVTIVAVAMASGDYANLASVTSDQVDPAPADNAGQVALTVRNAPGVFQFATARLSVAENSGQAIVTVTRSDGTQGTATVNYATVDGSAVAGRNYTATSGTLTFGPGETTKSFAIPLRGDGVVRGDLTVGLVLGAPTGGATLGANASAVLVVADSDRDTAGPTVVDVITRGGGRRLEGVTIVFSEPLDPARATDPANYQVFSPGRRGRGESPVALLRPTYDAATRTVTLTASSRLGLGAFHRLVVNADTASGVADLAGNLARGDASGANGRDYVGSFARGSTLRYLDSDGDVVRLKLSNGGLLDLDRDASGDGGTLRVRPVGARRNVLTGRVRPRRSGDGVTTLKSIDGAGFAGRVNSRLTTPSFFVDDVTAFIRAASAGGSQASARVLGRKGGGLA